VVKSFNPFCFDKKPPLRLERGQSRIELDKPLLERAFAFHPCHPL
jgi:hypothetical protein